MLHQYLFVLGEIIVMMDIYCTQELFLVNVAICCGCWFVLLILQNHLVTSYFTNKYVFPKSNRKNSPYVEGRKKEKGTYYVGRKLF